MIKVENSKLCLVVSDFNSIITDSMKKAAIHCFLQKGGNNKNIKIYQVSGAFEIPGVMSQILKNKKADIIVALGCIIKGQTKHYDYIATETSRAIMRMIVNYDIPIGFGVLTTDNMKQAIERSKDDNSNKGREAMEAALGVLNVYNEIQG